MKMIAPALLFCVSMLLGAQGQTSQAPITNSNIVNMVKAGVADETIILTIKRGPTKLDASPQALIDLKNAGISNQILDEVVNAASVPNQTALARTSNVDAQAIFHKALSALGPEENLASIHAIRTMGTYVVHSQTGIGTYQAEGLRIYSEERAYQVLQSMSGGSSIKLVMTPDFAYRSVNNSITAIPPDDLQRNRRREQFNPIFIAHRPQDYSVSVAGQAQQGGITVDLLKIGFAGAESTWGVDPSTGRLISTQIDLGAGLEKTDYSDYRQIGGMSLPFKIATTSPTRTAELTVATYEVNPTIDETVFNRPTQAVNPSLTIKVLQADSVPYTQESGGGISTNCSIIGSAQTSAYATSSGNNAFGNATTTSNQHMSCSSYDTTVRWPHVLNVMFVQASNGVSYIMACDRAWRWSKCVPLRAGQTFNAQLTEKGIEVQGFNSKGKEENPTYHVLQSKSWQ